MKRSSFRKNHKKVSVERGVTTRGIVTVRASLGSNAAKMLPSEPLKFDTVTIVIGHTT